MKSGPIVVLCMYLTGPASPTCGRARKGATLQSFVCNSDAASIPCMTPATMTRHTARGCHCKERESLSLQTAIANSATILEQSTETAQGRGRRTAGTAAADAGDPVDYERLRQPGVHLMAVPVELGGTWESLAQTALLYHATHPGQGDPSITRPVPCINSCSLPGACRSCLPPILTSDQAAS